jgi:outer membrane lipoprotein-sorting protein
MLSHLKRVSKFYFATICLSITTPAFAESEPNLRDISSYFNGIETMEARFQQYNGDGSLDTGTIYIRRPGRMRMEYDNDKALVLVSGGSVAIFDKKEEHAQQYPLRKTPLWLILKKNVDLGRPGAIKSIEHRRDLTRITAYDEETPEAGRVVFEFDNADGNIKFDGWKIRTDLGETITVRLRDVEMSMPLSNFLFSISHEKERRNRDH